MKRRASGLGNLYRPVHRTVSGELRESTTWWCRYALLNGRRITVNTRTSVKKDAETFLRGRVAARDVGAPAGPDPKVLTFDALVAMIRADYKANARRSLPRLNLALAHLSRFFEGPAQAITNDRITAYVAQRRDVAKPATVNRELAALRRALTLAHQAGKLARVPHIPALKENNARKGFFEAEQFESVLAHAPGYLRPLLETYYITGWRKADLLSRERRHLDLKAGWLRMEPGETKNDRGRMFPLVPRLRAVLEAQESATKELERLLGQRIPWLFHRGGAQIKDFRHAWEVARTAAGIPGRLIHDFRRTAVRNLIRAGVAQRVTMEMVGFETDSIFRRYAITDETMLREAGEKLARFQG